MKISIDVVIPSFRLDPKFLLPILSINIPEDCDLRYIVVVDNPNLSIPTDFDLFIERGMLSVYMNSINLGAHKSRNIGIDKGDGEWILFLDDDVVPDKNIIFHYVEAIKNMGDNVPGFVGLTKYPEPVNSFTKGVTSSDILTFFTLPKYYDEMVWGVTANLLIKRDAIRDIQFSNDFPKKGGGEDIDFCLRIMLKCNSKFVCTPMAMVTHPWWESRINTYRRFFRWAFGDSLLPIKHPEFKYYNFPNVVESLFLVLLVGVVSSILFDIKYPFISLMTGVVVGETFGEWLKLVILKKEYSLTNSVESLIVRVSNDFGRLAGNISRKRMNGLFERFDYFCDGKHIKHEKRWAFTKFSFYIIFAMLFYGVQI
jgi:GT2 family glycosyltransferase